MTTTPPVENDSRLDPHLRLDRREFDAEGALRDGTWSSGERALIEWAGALWSGRGTVDLGYVAGCLDDRFLHAALGALAAYRGQQLPAFDSAGDVVRPTFAAPAAPASEHVRQRTLARAHQLDELAARLRADGDHAQADEWTLTAAEMRGGAL